MSEHSLAVQALDKSYPTRSGPLPVLRGIDLQVSAGEALAILGPSGSGKSTLLQILGTLDRPTAGKVTLDGQDPFALSDAELARFRNRHVGFVFQDHHLLPQCSVLENVLIPTLAAGSVDKPAASRKKNAGGSCSTASGSGSGSSIDPRSSPAANGSASRSPGP